MTGKCVAQFKQFKKPGICHQSFHFTVLHKFVKPVFPIKPYNPFYRTMELHMKPGTAGLPHSITFSLSFHQNCMSLTMSLLTEINQMKLPLQLLETSLVSGPGYLLARFVLDCNRLMIFLCYLQSATHSTDSALQFDTSISKTTLPELSTIILQIHEQKGQHTLYAKPTTYFQFNETLSHGMKQLFLLQLE